MDLLHVSASPDVAWRPWPRHSHANVTFLHGERRIAERITERLFGRFLRPHEYAGLAGAPDDALVEVGEWSGQLYIELRDPVNHAYCGYFYLFCRKSAIVMSNEGFCINVQEMRGCGLGLQIFHRQARNAAELGVYQIGTVAGRKNNENGYYTWPRYGFQAPLPPTIQPRLSSGLNRCRTILRLMACENGREWWKEHGETLSVQFDLTPGSRSRRVLTQYIHERCCRHALPRTSVAVT